jgi:hypothetical protein
MMFYDDFDDTRFRWASNKQSEVISYKIEDGYYYINCYKRRKAVMSLQHLKIDENEDFEIETSIRNEGSGKKTGYGILLGYANVDNHYGYLINDKGEFTFFEREDGKIESIVTQQESEYLNQGKGATNNLMVKKEGEELKLYANDSIIAVTPFKSFYGTAVGIYVQRKQCIAVDYFRVIFSPEQSDEMKKSE